MAKKSQTVVSDTLESIQPETPEMETFLQAGYPEMDVETAEEIIKLAKGDPARYPLETVRKAKAFLEAYRNAPVAIDPRPGLFTGR